MSSEQVDQRYTATCAVCRKELTVRASWAGRDVQCPHCSAYLVVPPPPQDGRAAHTGESIGATTQRFSFACPRCESLLESHQGMAGQNGRCPTCDAQFIVPHHHPGMGHLAVAKLIESESQDPVPMHAYAASGHQAPKICRRGNGDLAIECPRCEELCDIGVNNCPKCGVPFTIDGVPTASGKPGQGLATASLVIGILGIPLFVLGLGGIALILAVAAWMRQSTPAPSRLAMSGLILGLAGTACSLLFWAN